MSFLTDDDPGRHYLEIVANHIALLRGEVEAHIIAWSQRWAPWLPKVEAEELAKRVAAKPRKWTATALGNELNLSAEERAALKITTIVAAGTTKAEREEQRIERNRASARKHRESVAAREGRTLRPRPGRPRKTRCRNGPCSERAVDVAVLR